VVFIRENITIVSGVVMLAAQFAALFVILFIGHHLGDYWVQTDRQAINKALACWRGRMICAEHVATYTATMLAVLLLTSWRLDIELDPWRVALALFVSAVSHYFADRRRPLRRLAIQTRHGALWLDGQSGLALLDQSWHLIWIFIAALIMA